ncbi:MAG TPA: bile acid:sodium symporter [Candidatus Saccharimonadales bacterium]|nr:bile acid:sodium symporter [Candidatus Saccharimonadales bacterium]
MNLINFFEKNFWLPLGISLLLGLALPSFGKNLSVLIIPVIMLNFFLSCLKIDFLEVVEHIKRPLFIIYILVIYLLIVPVVFYYIFQAINPDIAVGILLLASMPPGVSSIVLTDIFEGNASLSMAISIPAYLISPFTVPLLFLILTQKQIALDVNSLFKTLLFVNFFPLIVSQIVRKTSNKFIEKTKAYYNIVNILCIAVTIYIVTAVQAKNILGNPYIALYGVLWISMLFIGLYFIGYFAGFWRKKEDKIALAVSKVYMNNALAIGLAATFFSPKIALLMVLSEVPWAMTQGIFKYVTKQLN